MDPSLSIAGEVIPLLEDDSFRFLGMPVRVYSNNQTARTSMKESLKSMLEAVDQVPVTRQQKLRLFKQGICPRLSWLLMVEEFSIT